MVSIEYFLVHLSFLLKQTQPDTLSALVKTEDKGTDVSFALAFGLIPVVLGFSFIIFVIYRSRREAEFKRRETELKLSKAEGELKALRAQINPHFIFNCLNSIHYFIKTNEAGLASDYLIKFSKLIRYVLESSEKNWVSLEEELESNKIYLELEQLRTKGSFEFEFFCDPSLQTVRTFIPPMLIQPFLENAVWHGHSSQGKICMKIQRDIEDILSCEITDEGFAKMEKSNFDLSNTVKKSSMGIHLMGERFKTLNEMRGLNSRFEFQDNPNKGRFVRLNIPFEEE